MGTFNPIHNGHLQMAETVLEQTKMDKIIFIPAFLPPHKDIGVLNPIHRLKILEIAVENNKHFEVDPIEYKRNEKSYTYYTIKELYKNYEHVEGKINLIIGEDAFAKIASWHKAQELADLVKFLILPRSNDFKPDELIKKIELDRIDYQVINAPFIDISSTKIRERIRNNQSLKGFVPKKVEIYLKQNKLYE